MRFVITCRARKVLFQGKENKTKKKNLLNCKERRKEERKTYLKIMAGKSSIEKTSDKRGMCFNWDKSVKTDIPSMFIIQQTFP
jgi:hypothetical protein